MASYILFDPARHELRLKCSLCGEVTVLATTANIDANSITPDPALLVSHHYRGDRLGRGRCRTWYEETQDFYVKDLSRTLKTRKFSWPNEDDEEDYEYYIHCSVCGEEEGYSGSTDVGADKFCEICDHPLVRHTITVSAGWADPDTGAIDLPRFK